MRKRVLFMLISMNVGGTERAFLNMLQGFPKEKYEVTVLLLQKKGGLYQDLPEHVLVREMKEFPYVGRHTSYNPKEKVRDHLSQHRYIQALILFIIHSYMRITKDRTILFRNVFKRVPMLEEEYDIAVAYAGPMDIITYYIAMRVKATEKYQWIHFDVNQIGFDYRFAKRMYKYFDRINVVSKTAALHLKKKLPTLSSKIEVKVNTFPAVKITKLAGKKDVFLKSPTIRIVTVGRIMKEKGPDIAVKTLYELKKRGYNIRWHWIGDGIWITHIKEIIQKFKIEDSFILEGLKGNPFPYIRQCDIYVQPSRHEGYCLTIAEAKSLNKPIVTTATAGGIEQIKHGETGLISEINEKELLNNIVKLIKEPGLKNKFSHALQMENEEKTMPVYERNLLTKRSSIL